MQGTAPTASTKLEIAYSRPAFRTLARLEAGSRLKVARLVNGIAANAERITQRTSSTFSADAGPGLRIVFLRGPKALTVLALTGEDTRA